MENEIEKGQQRTEAMYEALPIERDDIVMLGDSLIEEGPWDELFPDVAIKNRGIGGQTAAQILQRLDPVLSGQPAMIFLMAGTNDLDAGDDVDAVLGRLQTIITRILSESPDSGLVVNSLLPREPELSGKITALNEALQSSCAQCDVGFLDLYTEFADDDGSMPERFSNDGVHLLPAGYAVWQRLMLDYLPRSSR